MVDYEKTINALGRCESYGYCEDKKCPYYECVGCLELVRKGALTLIQQQQARIAELEAAQTARAMKITEAMDAEVAWLERYADPKDGVESIIQPVIIKYYENGYWQCLLEQDENPDLTLFIEDYNTGFRFWTKRPADEQKEAIPWR